MSRSIEALKTKLRRLSFGDGPPPAKAHISGATVERQIGGKRPELAQVGDPRVAKAVRCSAREHAGKRPAWAQQFFRTLALKLQSCATHCASARVVEVFNRRLPASVCQRLPDFMAKMAIPGGQPPFFPFDFGQAGPGFADGSARTSISMKGDLSRKPSRRVFPHKPQRVDGFANVRQQIDLLVSELVDGHCRFLAVCSVTQDSQPPNDLAGQFARVWS